jgi:hypothetical protein
MQYIFFLLCSSAYKYLPTIAIILRFKSRRERDNGTSSCCSCWAGGGALLLIRPLPLCQAQQRPDYRAALTWSRCSASRAALRQAAGPARPLAWRLRARRRPRPRGKHKHRRRCSTYLRLQERVLFTHFPAGGGAGEFWRPGPQLRRGAPKQLIPYPHIDMP